ncbi:ABC transporter permease [Ensifer aridi]|uniref:ABC transporter permease n=1 Tax=Ensifer aridi TaxID=1708715 RepID=UPI000A10847E|nr:ABC transporter permease [Ensifer aridi]
MESSIQAKARGNRGFPLAFSAARTIATAVLQFCLTLFGLFLATFLIGRVIPVDPVVAVLGDRAGSAAHAAARAQLGLDLPLWRQFISYAGDVLHGNLGTSILTGQPVLQDIGQFLPATLELATTATVIGVLFGLPAGVIAAACQGRPIDHVLRTIMIAGYSVPVFWLGIVGLIVFYAKLDWVAGPGRVDITYQYLPAVTGFMLFDAVLARDIGFFVDAVRHLILPAGVLGYYSAALIARMARSAVITELQQEYVLTARLKGLSSRHILWRHALPNALLPIITTATMTYGYLLEGAVLTESVFAWPGLGLYITQSLFSADLSAVLGTTLFIGLCFIGLNVLADLLYRLVDPRVR